MEAILGLCGGFDVIEARDGPEAVGKARQELPDLIILDVRMPRINGYEACRRLKELEETKDIPVMFLSARGQRQEIEEGLAAGAIEYMLKPFDPMHLISTVRDILDVYC